MRRRGFTLVELLVVIGVVAVLMGVLMPSLRNARRSAELIRCAANLRQIGAAIQAYAGENRGVLPFAAMKVVPAGGGTHASFWCLSWDDLISDQLGCRLTTGEKEGAFNYKGIAALVCPADPIGVAFNTPGVKRRSYAMVRGLKVGPVDGKPFSGVAGEWTVNSLAGYVPNPKYQLKVTQVRRAAKTFMVVEHANAWNAQGYDYEAYVDVPGQVSQYVRGAGDGLSVARARETFHGGRWKFLFVDGHVMAMRLEETVGVTGAGSPDFATARGAWTRDPND